MKKFFMLLILALSLFAGCGLNKSSSQLTAQLTITNSNGKVTQVTCPGAAGCDKLEKSLNGDLYKETDRYSENPEIESGSIDLTKPEYKPKKLPGTIKTQIGPPNLNKNPYKEGQACFIVKYGSESIRVQGNINGQEVDFIRNQKDDCQAEEYGLWDEFFNVE
jgi:hypothetical protein